MFLGLSRHGPFARLTEICGGRHGSTQAARLGESMLGRWNVPSAYWQRRDAHRQVRGRGAKGLSAALTAFGCDRDAKCAICPNLSLNR